MSSLVLELQQEAMDPKSDIASLLRKCVVIATKLKLNDFLDWTNSELRGYENKTVPDYRRVPAELKVFNPYNGVWMPFMFQGEGPSYSRERLVGQSIAELTDLVRERKGHLEMPLPNELAMRLMSSVNAPRPPTSIISQNSIIGILDAVRNVVLDWSLKLEADGILGEGMTFNQQEKQAAMSHTYNIENFTGILGNVNANSVSITSYDDLHKKLKESGIPQEERLELEQIMDQVPKSAGESKEKLLQKALNWTVKNAQNLGTLSTAIHTWIQNQQQ